MGRVQERERRGERKDRVPWDEFMEMVREESDVRWRSGSVIFIGFDVVKVILLSSGMDLGGGSESWGGLKGGVGGIILLVMVRVGYGGWSVGYKF